MRKLNKYCSDDFRSLFAAYGMGIQSARTLDEYISYINLLMSHVKKDFLLINGSDAQGYIDYLVTDARLSARTINARLSCYKSVARHVVETGKHPAFANPFELVRPLAAIDGANISSVRIPTIAEMDKVMSAARDLSPMWYLIMALASRTCLTSTNILRIRKESVFEEKGRVFLHYPPTETQHEDLWVELPGDVRNLMLAYLETCPVSEDGHIFFNEHNHPLTLRNMDSAVKKMVRLSGIGKRYTLKDFRSRGILDLAQAGVDPEKIGLYTGLGHLRIRSFVTAKHLISGECPAEMVNYRVV